MKLIIYIIQSDIVLGLFYLLDITCCVKLILYNFLTLFLNNCFTKIKFSLPFLCSPFLNVLSLQLFFVLIKFNQFIETYLNIIVANQSYTHCTITKLLSSLEWMPCLKGSFISTSFCFCIQFQI